MRNKKGFYVKSANCENALLEKQEVLKILQSDLRQKGINPYDSNLEWHHNGKYISFFSSSENDNVELENFKKLLDSKSCIFKSKAEAIKYVENLPKCKENDLLALRIKKGKYGNFVTFDKSYYSKQDTFKKAPNSEVYQALFNLFY